MTNKNYVSGRAFEYRRKEAWEAKGYQVIRSAGSHGPFDLIAFHWERPVELIQCKRVKTLKAAERLIKAFVEDPPQLPSRFFHQSIEIYVSNDHKVVSRVV